jgi:uncharacterized protein with ParB-like and HNH nuclease domain/predicted transport protein
LGTVTMPSQLLVIDGQQRLTTVILLLEALKRALREEEPVEGFSAEKIKTRYLTRHLEKGEKFYKLLLSQTDDETLKAIVREGELPVEASLRVKENFKYFVEKIEDLKGDFAPLCQGIAKLAIVDIALSRGEDNPQLIFESMNSTGKALSAADLIRNYILMGLQPDLQTRLYENYWRPMEVDFGQLAYGEEFDSFMRHFLTVKNKEIPRSDQIYETFKIYAHRSQMGSGTVEEVVKEIRLFAGYYCAMTLGKEKESNLRASFNDLKEFKVDVAYPFLLEVYDDYRKGLLVASDFVQIVRLVETYAFRRAVVQIPTNSMNKTFARFMLSVDKSNYFESIKAALMTLTSYRRFPTDEEFSRDLAIRDLYNSRNRLYWLKKIESFGRKELPLFEEFSIEHIMPQNPDLNEWWRSALGPEWPDVQVRLLHTIGNLTLTKYNSEFSDKPFPEKRDLEKGGFKSSPLVLNEGLGVLETWNEETIGIRANALIMKALKVWSAPSFDRTLVASASPKDRPRMQYSYDDHKNLSKPKVMEIFNSLKTEILALDPLIYEDVLKLYIAFKAETNFVDIVVQSQCLQLTLNMSFAEIEDPQRRCVDIRALGKWGNGDVSFRVNSEEDIPYAMFLIRQSFEQQFDQD